MSEIKTKFSIQVLNEDDSALTIDEHPDSDKFLRLYTFGTPDAQYFGETFLVFSKSYAKILGEALIKASQE